MREILFRGQTRKYGEKVRMGDGKKLPGRWVYGGVLQGVGDYSIIYGGENENDPSESLEKWCVYTDTLGQFTGLTDKNGKKIFEGDIVKATVIQNQWSKTRKYTEIFVVAYHPKYCYFYLKREGNNLLFDGNWSYGVFIDEVVGNIHDNPELLEGGAEDGK